MKLKQRGRASRILVLLAATTMVQGHPATASAVTAFRVVASPTVPAQLDGIASVSAHEAWAVGFRGTGAGPRRTLVEHWNGSSWAVASSASLRAGDDVRFHAVAGVTANQVWAVGNDVPSGGAPGHSLIERWDGTSWSLIPGPAQEPAGSELLAITALSSSDVWAVGHANSSGSFHTLIEHWNGIRWSVIPGAPIATTGHDFLTGVSGSGAGDVWAVGRTFRHPVPLVEHWNGSRWSVVSQPVSGYDSSLWSVSVVNGADAWAVGSQNLNQTVTEHWDGATWSLVPSPSPNAPNDQNALQSVVALGHNDAWTVGRTLVNFSQDQTLAEHWDGTSWRLVTTPDPATQDFLTAVAGSGSGAPLWAVGGTNSSGLILETSG